MAVGDDTKLILWLLILLSYLSSCFSSDLDVQCLKTLKESVVDPNGVLSSTWIFDNSSHGFLCQFTGVECWQPDKNRVLALHLSNLGLQGGFPQGLEKCTSMSGLNLSSNNFAGPIPSDLAQQMPNLTSLDLSYNSFSGEIPIRIWDIKLLSVLFLQHNQFSGQIPDPFSWLDGLALFSVSDNQLSGPIPWALHKFSPSTFSGNENLCDTPLGDCPIKSSPTINGASSIGAAAGFVVGFVVAFYFPRLFICSRRLRPYFFQL